MGIWAELGIFALALAFGLWQLWDVRKAREQSRRQRGSPPVAARPGANTAPKQPSAPQPADHVAADQNTHRP